MLSLDWLSPHSGLGAAITAARALPATERLQTAIRLARHRRDALATLRLDRLAQEALAETPVPAGWQRRSLAVLGSATLDALIPAIRVAALERRLVLDVTLAPYGQYRQAILEPYSPLDATPPDFILLALDESAVLPPLPLTTSAAETDAALDAELDGLVILWRRARERFGAALLQPTILNTRLTLFGSYEPAVVTSPAAMLDRLNRRLVEAAAAEGVMIVDVDRAAAGSGREHWFDPVRWHQAKQPVASEAMPLYGDLVARVLAAACGLSRKCLVLDLDNTLWGGVIGDDGLDGIVLGQGSAAGEAYLAFQRHVASLAERGVVLALCSKNDAAVVEEVFARHPEMHLKRQSIAAAAVNWTDKATNLRSLAATLDLGLDSFVFVDDNPAERDIVRRELPMVAVPELPDDVALYPAALARAGYFEAIAFTAEDGTRSRQYADNTKRKESLAQATDMDGFLRSLEMRLEARPPANGDLVRIAQLINKSNQFNLTTRRYTAEEVERAAGDPQIILRGFRLVDRFGDNGLVAVIIARPHADEAEALSIDTWLMSCRVLGRGVEGACLNVLARAAADAGATALIGEYRSTPRNSMVRDHYRRLGFAPAGNGGDSTYWRLDLTDFHETQCHIRIDS